VEFGGEKKLEVVIKLPPFNKARRNDFGSMDLFKREVFMYNEVLPEFVKFQRERNIDEADGFYNIPKCYFAEFNVERDDSAIIMEDLRENGCKMWDKYQPINMEHAKLLLTALGRFHAVSFALKAQKPEIFDKFKEMKDYLFLEMFAENKMAPSLYGFLDKAAESLDETDIENRSKIFQLKKKL